MRNTNKCPYLRNRQKCIHKDCNFKKIKKRRVCPYKDKKDCEMHNEWDIVLKSFVRASKPAREVSKN